VGVTQFIYFFGACGAMLGRKPIFFMGVISSVVRFFVFQGTSIVSSHLLEAFSRTLGGGRF